MENIDTGITEEEGNTDIMANIDTGITEEEGNTDIMENIDTGITEEEQDDAGMASIEEFLDRIEDPDESILQSFQNDFEIVKVSLGITTDLNDDNGSCEYKANKELSEKWESDAGSVQPNKKSNDGFELSSWTRHTELHKHGCIHWNI